MKPIEQVIAELQNGVQMMGIAPKHRGFREEFTRVAIAHVPALIAYIRALEQQVSDMRDERVDYQFALAREQMAQEVTGNTSDGYHTFNELYHHRAVLFSIVCNDRPRMAWKAKLHEDGTMFSGMFIVGINTPNGRATYHYDVDPYWDMFKISEFERAPKWDRHTAQDAITRIGQLEPVQEWIPCSERLPVDCGQWVNVLDKDNDAEFPIDMVLPAYFKKGEFRHPHAGRTFRDITHWLPMPPMPGEKEG